MTEQSDRKGSDDEATPRSHNSVTKKNDGSVVQWAKGSARVNGYACNAGHGSPNRRAHWCEVDFARARGTAPRASVSTAHRAQQPRSQMHGCYPLFCMCLHRMLLSARVVGARQPAAVREGEEAADGPRMRAQTVDDRMRLRPHSGRCERARQRREGGNRCRRLGRRRDLEHAVERQTVCLTKNTFLSKALMTI